MDKIIFLISGIIVSYFIGAIPTGFIFGKIMGKDIRNEGSGNIGATNVLRVLGTVPGIIVLIIDSGKAFLTLFFLKGIYFSLSNNFNFSSTIIFIILGLSILLGNIFNPFLKFKGGKGVAASVGVLLFFNPILVLCSLIIFLIITALTKYVSLGSTIAALCAVLLSFFIEFDPVFSVFIFFLASFIIYKHRSNIKRLLNRTENKINFKK